MSTSAGNVDPGQRFTPAHPCPICGGHDRMKRGQGERCHGYISGNGRWAFCARRESDSTIQTDAGTLYKHPLGDDPRPAPAPANGKQKRSYKSPAEAIRWAHGKLGRLAGNWTYHDAEGRAVLVVYRFDCDEVDPDTGKPIKTYRPVARGPDGRWINGDSHLKTLPLYHLPELAEGPVVVVTEGEKACDAVRALGLVATSPAHGAESPWRTDWGPLAGKTKTAVIWPDNDAPGERFMEKVGEILAGLDPRPTIKVIRPEVPPKGDAVEWIAAGGTADRLRELIDDTPPWSPPADDGHLSNGKPTNKGVKGVGAYRVPDDPDDDEDGPDDLIQVDEPPRIATDSPAFWGVLGEIALKHSRETEAPPVSVLAHLLVGVGVLIGRGPVYLVGATKHRPILYALLIGPTGRGRKGTSQDIAVAYLDCAEDDFSSHHVRDNFVSAEGLIHTLRDGGDQPGNTEVQRQRLFYLEAEGSRIFDVARREGNTLAGQLCTAWDAKLPLQVGRRNSPDVSSHYALGVVAHITPEELQMKIRSVDVANGTVNRFLTIYAERDHKVPLPRPITPDSKLVTRLGKAVLKAREIDKPIRWTGAGEAAYEEWYHAQPDLPPGLLGSLLARREPQVTRMAFSYALADGAPHIDAEHLQRATALWAHCERSASYVFGQSLGDPDAEKVLTALATGPMRRNQIRKDVFQRNKSAAEIDLILGRLLKYGRITQHEIKTDRRPATEFRLRR